jgi:hypothetical protein
MLNQKLTQLLLKHYAAQNEILRTTIMNKDSIMAYTMDTAKPILWLRQLPAGLSPWRARFMSESVHVEFVVDNVALGQAFLSAFGSFPVNVIPLWLSILINHLEDEQ